MFHWKQNYDPKELLLCWQTLEYSADVKNWDPWNQKMLTKSTFFKMHLQTYPSQDVNIWWNMSDFRDMVEAKGEPVRDIKEYASGSNTEWLEQSQLAALISKI